MYWGVLSPCSTDFIWHRPCPWISNKTLSGTSNTTNYFPHVFIKWRLSVSTILGLGFKYMDRETFCFYREPTAFFLIGSQPPTHPLPAPWVEYWVSAPCPHVSAIIYGRQYMGSHRGLVVSVVDCGPTRRQFGLPRARALWPSAQWSMTRKSKALVVQPCLCNWAYKRFHATCINE